MKVRGLYLAVATLAAQFFSDWLFLRVDWFALGASAGSASVQGLTIAGFSLSHNMTKYLFCLSLLTLCALFVRNLARSTIGRTWMAIRDMDVAATVIGIRPLHAKMSAFGASSFILGVAGAMWAFLYLGAWEPEAFGLDLSLQLLFMVIIGGLGSVLGSVLGAAFITLLPIALARFLPGISDLGNISISSTLITHVEVIIFGTLIVAVLIIEPMGLARLWATMKQKLRIWPYPH